MCKESREDKPHLTSEHCKVYGDLPEKYSNLTYDENLVQFFSEVLSKWDLLEKE